jgi:hypothetical protein
MFTDGWFFVYVYEYLIPTKKSIAPSPGQPHAIAILRSACRLTKKEIDHELMKHVHAWHARMMSSKPASVRRSCNIHLSTAPG